MAKQLKVKFILPDNIEELTKTIKEEVIEKADEDTIIEHITTEDHKLYDIILHNKAERSIDDVFIPLLRDSEDPKKKGNVKTGTPVKHYLKRKDKKLTKITITIPEQVIMNRKGGENTIRLYDWYRTHKIIEVDHYSKTFKIYIPKDGNMIGTSTNQINKYAAGNQIQFILPELGDFNAIDTVDEFSAGFMEKDLKPKSQFSFYKMVTSGSGFISSLEDIRKMVDCNPEAIGTVKMAQTCYTRVQKKLDNIRLYIANIQKKTIPKIDEALQYYQDGDFKKSKGDGEILALRNKRETAKQELMKYSKILL